jgi:hypothetical protein
MDSTRKATSADGDSVSELTINFAETARALFSAGDVSATLSRVVDLAVATIDTCDFASITLLEEGVVRTHGERAPIVAEVDGYQYAAGQAPGLAALTQRIIIYADDLSTDSRWPEFGAKATEVGIRSLLALPLTGIASQGCLNLYARYPSAFGVVDRGKAVILSSLATLALTAAQSHETEDLRAENLRAALSSREIIGQAEGILMERERITAVEAFDILRRASQHLNVKLREVAQNLVDTGEDPDTGAPRSAS